VKPKGGIALSDVQEVVPNEEQPIYGFNVVTRERIYRISAKVRYLSHFEEKPLDSIE